jgi:hypothetical protein
MGIPTAGTCHASHLLSGWIELMCIVNVQKLITRIAVLTVSLLYAALISCHNATSMEPKVRPVGVPQDAVWAGGADGGAYVKCRVDATRNVNPCSVWNDYSGVLIESGNYRLLKEGRAATESELKVAFPDFGGSILLEGGQVLKLQK